MTKAKKILFLMAIAIVSAIIPVVTHAKEPINIYFFKGETCGFCARAKTFFESLENDSEYKDLFVLKEYEIWNNKKNADLAEDAAKIMGDELDGVPYFIIGDKSWNGYTADYDEEIKKQIKAVYEDESFVDPLKDLISGEKETDESWVTSAVILVVAIGLIGGIIYFARQDTEEDEEPKKEKKIVETNVQEVSKNEEVKEIQNKSTTNQPQKNNKNSAKKNTKKKK